MKRFLIYLFRWQLSTLVLAPVMWGLQGFNVWLIAGVSNLIGGCLFYLIDKRIFKSQP
jgi:hypothetical protein